MDYPLARLAYNRKLLKKFDETGKIAIPLTDWIRFFEALAVIYQEGHRENYFVIVEGYLVFSQTTFKETRLCHISKSE
jgi:hypothetical protein